MGVVWQVRVSRNLAVDGHVDGRDSVAAREFQHPYAAGATVDVREYLLYTVLEGDPGRWSAEPDFASALAARAAARAAAFSWDVRAATIGGLVARLATTGGAPVPTV